LAKVPVGHQLNTKNPLKLQSFLHTLPGLKPGGAQGGPQNPHAKIFDLLEEFGKHNLKLLNIV